MARLTRENNQLHAALLRARDEGDAALVAQQTEAVELRASVATTRQALQARERELRAERCVGGWAGVCGCVVLGVVVVVVSID